MIIALLAHVALLGLTVFGLVTSWRERFIPGAIGGLLRVALLLFAIVAVVRLQYHLTEHMPRQAFMPAIGAAALGPMLTNAILALAYVRRRRAGPSDEERAGKPFGAWMGAAAIDVAVLFVTVFSAFMATKQDGT